MTVATALLIAAVVVAVRLIPSVRWKAVVYALPLPMTLALVASGAPVDARHLIGVVLLVLFFVLAGLLHHRFGLHILLADTLAIVAYLLVAWPLTTLGDLPFLPVLAAVCVLWAAIGLRRPPPPEAGPPQPRRRPTLPQVALVVAAALLIAQFAGVLQAFVVTFPYSGVLVVIETRRSLPAFTRQFARASLALVAFLTAFHLAAPLGTGWALAAAWAAHVTITTALLLTGARPARRPDALTSGAEAGH
ncbi:hypothetical protein [Catenuloplanes indicus]|uniref:Uncharacterized protein n=1 Tax=Catenuloplanes indicus TaxID=137267 RepID=A0AAE4B2B3_9ACTN|nr:hypothetical protein [Catenuloplanes indicus]MDQ0371477.1 hypothetical protein [Catenuloplanes indicus]